tara:strand:- start:2833 stop:3207 length:375 start_codon:yes stop_codon:yes gene_type:complete
MASSHLVSKTIQLHEKRDPIRNLWRNVLIIGIEDLLKSKEKQIIRKEKKFSNEEIWFYHEDFKLICEYAQLDCGTVKKRVFEAIERMRNKYEKQYMPKMPRKWIHKNKILSRQSSRNYSTMSVV